MLVLGTCAYQGVRNVSFIGPKLRVWSQLLKKSLMENFIFRTLSEHPVVFRIQRISFKEFFFHQLL